MTNCRPASVNDSGCRQAEGSVAEAADRLVRALEADPDHTRQHTRVLLRARDWDTRGRAASALARGEELTEAENWLTRAQGREPAPTELQAAWIAAGRHAAARRQRTMTLTSLAVSVIALALLTFALFSRAQAVDARAQADGARAAEHSRALAAEADGQLSRDPQLSILLAEQALKAKATPEAMLAASRALDANTARSQLPTLGAQPCALAMRLAELSGGNQVAVTTCDGRLAREDLVRRTIDERLRVGATAGPVARSGRTLAVGTQSGITLVDAQRWTIRGRISTPFPINALAFSASGRRLAVAAPDRVAVVNLRHRGIRTLARMNGPFDDLLNVAWAGTRTVLAGGFDVPPQTRAFASGVAAIDVKNGKVQPIRLLGGTSAPFRVAAPGETTSNVEGLSVAPDGSAWFITGKVAPLATISGGHAEVWRVDPDTHRVVWHASGPTDQYATAAALSPDQRRIAVGYGAGLAAVLDARTGDTLVRLPGHTTAVRALLFRSGHAPVVTASQDGVVRTWAGDGTERLRLHMPAAILGLASQRDSDDVLGFGAGSVPFRIETDHGPATPLARLIPRDVVDYAWSNEHGHLMVAYRARGRLTVFDARTGALVGQPRHFAEGAAFGVGPSGRVLTADADRNGTLHPRLFDPRTGTSHPLAQGPALCLAGAAEFSPNESRVAVYDQCGRVEIYDIASGRLLRTAQLADRTTANVVAWAPDSSHLYFGVAGGSLVVLDVRTGQIQERPGSQEAANGVDVSPDSRFVAVGGSGGIVDIYDTRTLRLVRQHVLPQPVEAVALGPSSLTVLDENHTLRVWDTCGSCEDPAALERQARAESIRSLTPGERATFGV
ncbi:MAG TPA: WD40 repeat domain-containing protein [Mycobacteriales bacterium]|nr:WD40 repeat domain-containing protein [Mycobacteriales bacterium]